MPEILCDSINIPYDLITSKEVARILNVDRTTLSHWRSDNKGPPYYKLDGGNRLYYSLADLAQWLERQKVYTAETILHNILETQQPDDKKG